MIWKVIPAENLVLIYFYILVENVYCEALYDNLIIQRYTK